MQDGGGACSHVAVCIFTNLQVMLASLSSSVRIRAAAGSLLRSVRKNMNS